MRAATVLRALATVGEADADSRGGVAHRGERRRRRLFIGAVAVVLLLASGSLLVGAVRTRRGGQSITGNAQSRPADIAALAQAAHARPQDVRAQLDYAQALLADGQALDALKVFDATAGIDPTDGEAQAYGGWILSLAGLTDEAMARLDAAVAAVPSYPDAHFFRGMTLLRGRGDRTGGLAELREFVRLTPPGPERAQVQALIDETQPSPAP